MSQWSGLPLWSVIWHVAAIKSYGEVGAPELGKDPSESTFSIFLFLNVWGRVYVCLCVEVRG